MQGNLISGYCLRFPATPAKFRKNGEEELTNVKISRLFAKFHDFLQKLPTFCETMREPANSECGAVQKCANLVNLKRMRRSQYLVAKIGFDTAENGPNEIFVTYLPPTPDLLVPESNKQLCKLPAGDPRLHLLVFAFLKIEWSAKVDNV